jgi:hypothetical protein
MMPWKIESNDVVEDRIEPNRGNVDDRSERNRVGVWIESHRMMPWKIESIGVVEDRIE